MSERVDLLVIGTSIDPHIDRVLSRLGDISVCRLDVDRYPKEIGLSISVEGRPKVVAREGGNLYDITRPRVAWFRRLGRPGISPKVDKRYRSYISSEAEQMIEGLLDIVEPSFWFNSLSNVKRCQRKAYQYAIASHLGLRLPNTLLSSDVDFTKLWLSQIDDAVVKTISRPLIGIEEGQHDGRIFAFTHRLTSHDMAQFNRLSLSPCQFQQTIEPAYELRVTTVDGHHHVAEIRSHDANETRLDWRATATECSYSQGTLDGSAGSALNRLMSHFELSFAASDFIVDHDGNTWFLETNPNGAWLWLEDFIANFDVTAEVSSALKIRVEESKKSGE